MYTLVQLTQWVVAIIASLLFWEETIAKVLFGLTAVLTILLIYKVVIGLKEVKKK